ncbi:unnamed protein product [Phytomonas sp. EM1]|nr:unnamed protein product [Phytomonas sp. EM1]|eukprot:CCW63962.1 unnamed protein product [Phytomonas sp. isolate EM1]
MGGGGKNGELLHARAALESWRRCLREGRRIARAYHARHVGGWGGILAVNLNRRRLPLLWILRLTDELEDGPRKGISKDEAPFLGAIPPKQEALFARWLLRLFHEQELSRRRP